MSVSASDCICLFQLPLCVVTVQNNPLTLKNLLTTYSNVFKKELGTLSGFKVKLNVKPGSKPQFCRARQIPYAIRDAVDGAEENRIIGGE